MIPAWTRHPEELGTVDAHVVRCIAGELDRVSLVHMTRSIGVDGLRRMHDLLTRHTEMNSEQLRSLSMLERHRIADDIVIAESEAASTMPGDLAPLRTCDPS